ncbi:hypothetical protein ACFOEE_17625 [Pseudoalteromonas fenneropenaei]|uniref:CHAT domain-containing protein n=1 Tax=Pseudoalteromonas fenneropenaei TaxID=1737459 RepID=A0ABV7CNS2_9GAMM
MAVVNKKRAHNAILILESPWGLDDTDNNRTSVLPFIEGAAKRAGDTEVYHANFYDKSSFNKALECITRSSFDNSIIYIAAHGYKKKVGEVNIDHILFEVGELSKTHNITGIMFGSCFVGENITSIEVYLQETSIRWCAGYASSTWWFEGTLIDTALISYLSALGHEGYSSKESMIEAFSDAIKPFAENFAIGQDYKERLVSLKDSLKIVIQPTGKGYRARDVTDVVFEHVKESRL